MRTGPGAARAGSVNCTVRVAVLNASVAVFDCSTSAAMPPTKTAAASSDDGTANTTAVAVYPPLNGPEDGLTEVMACTAASIGTENVNNDEPAVQVNTTLSTGTEEKSTKNVERERVVVNLSSESTLCVAMVQGDWHLNTNAAASSADECSIATETRFLPGNTDAGFDCSRTLLNIDTEPDTAVSGRVTGTTLNGMEPVVALIEGNTNETTVDAGKAETTTAAIALPATTTLIGPDTGGKLLMDTDITGESREETVLGTMAEITVFAGEYVNVKLTDFSTIPKGMILKVSTKSSSLPNAEGV